MIRDEDVPRTTLASRAVPGLLPTRRALLWRGLHDAGSPDKTPEIWAELRNQAPLAAGPDGPLFSMIRSPELPTFALFAPNMGLTASLSDAFADFLADFRAGGGCLLSGELIVAAVHLFLGARWRRDVIALNLSLLDQMLPDMSQLPQRRREMMADCGLGKVRALTRRWAPLDSRGAWSWGAVRWVYMLVRPSVRFSTVRERVGNLSGLLETGHWVLTVYDRRADQVMLYDTREYVTAENREAHVVAVWNVLTGYGLFSRRLIVDPEIPHATLLEAWRKRNPRTRGAAPRLRARPANSMLLAIPAWRLRIAYSQGGPWECGVSVIHMARILLAGRDLWQSWASDATKRRADELTVVPGTRGFTEVTLPQRKYAREELLEVTLRDLVAYLDRMAASGLWRIP